MRVLSERSESKDLSAFGLMLGGIEPHGPTTYPPRNSRAAHTVTHEKSAARTDPPAANNSTPSLAARLARTPATRSSPATDLSLLPRTPVATPPRTRSATAPATMGCAAALRSLPAPPLRLRTRNQYPLDECCTAGPESSSRRPTNLHAFETYVRYPCTIRSVDPSLAPPRTPPTAKETACRSGRDC